MPVILLITNRKSHTGFRLVATSMILNDLERRRVIALIMCFFTEFDALQADYVTVVEYRPIMSAKYRLSVPVFCFWPKLTHPAARSFCDS